MYVRKSIVSMTSVKTVTEQTTKVINLLDLTSVQLKYWLESIDTVLFDCDGVLWHENVPIEGSPQVVAALQALGKRVFFVTNNGMKTRNDILQRANNLGYSVTENEVLIPSYSVAKYLKDRNFKQRVYLMGSPAICTELNAVGIKYFGTGPDVLNDTLSNYMKRELLSNEENDDVGAVIVGFDEHFSFCKVLKASHYLSRNPDCHFLATNGDVVFKTPTCRIPDTGAMLKAVETCVGRQAVQLGKPNPIFCETLIRDCIAKPERTLMVGDSVKIDILFGKNCNFQTLLVGSGQTHWSEIECMLKDYATHQHYIPQYYLPKLGDLLPFV